MTEYNTTAGDEVHIGNTISSTASSGITFVLPERPVCPEPSSLGLIVQSILLLFIVISVLRLFIEPRE